MFLKKRAPIRAWLVPALLVSAVLLSAVVLAGAAGRQASRRWVAAAGRSLSRAAVECYALEGSYPPSYAYLSAHYGVGVNSQLYYVDYLFVGQNLMPEITVLPRAAGSP